MNFDATNILFFVPSSPPSSKSNLNISFELILRVCVFWGRKKRYFFQLGKTVQRLGGILQRKDIKYSEFIGGVADMTRKSRIFH